MAFGLKKVFSKHGGRILEKWVFDAKSQLVSSAGVAEIDGKQHVVFGTKNGQVVCLDEAGQLKWSYSTEEKIGNVESFFVDNERVHSIDAAPIIADIDRDGKVEIIVCSERGFVYCISTKGELLWKYDCGASIRASPMVEDINNDGKQEIVVGSVNNKLTVLTCQGKKLFEYNSDAPIESVPAVLRGKKTLILFGNNKGVLTALLPSQEVAWRMELDAKIVAAPTVYIDDEPRFVVGTIGGDMVCGNERGELLWHYKTRGSIYGSAAAADLNNDGRMEIVFGSCDNAVYALSGDGQKLWSYETEFWVTATPLVADIDGDGKPEVIIGSYDHNVYILDAEGSYVLDYVPGLSGIVSQTGHYTNILTSDPGEQTGKKLYQYKTGGIVVGCALMQRHEDKPTLLVNVKTGNVKNLEHGE